MTPEETQRALVSIAAFLKRYAASYRRTGRTRMLEVLRWYWCHGLVGVIREGGKIVAVCTARCVRNAEEGGTPYVHDEAAPIVWVDEIVSRHPHGVALLLRQAQERFGPREAFAGTVFNRDGELRMLPMKTVERLIDLIPQNEHQHSRPTAAA